MRDQIIAAMEGVWDRTRTNREAAYAERIKAYLPEGQGVLVAWPISREDIPLLADAVLAAIIHHEAPLADEALVLAADRERLLYWLARVAEVPDLPRNPTDPYDELADFQALRRLIADMLTGRGCDHEHRLRLISAGPPLDRKAP